MFHIIEYVEKEKLLIIEQIYLDIFYDDQQMCYNMCPKAYSSIGRKVSEETKLNMSKAKKGKCYLTKEGKEKLQQSSSKTYDINIISPNSEIFGPITNLAKFAREHNLDVSCLRSLIKGKSVTHKGWKLENGRSRCYMGNNGAKSFIIKGPNGIIYHEKNLVLFCKRMNLHRTPIWEVLNGKRKFHKGWVLPSNNEKSKNTKTYDVKIQSPSGEIYGPIEDAPKFTKEHKLNYKSFGRLLIKKIKIYNGWKLLN